MRRSVTLALLIGLLMTRVSVPPVTNVAAISHSSSWLAKKICKTKKVHGKKKKVCTNATPPQPKSTATPTLSLAQRVDTTLTANHFSGSILLEKGGQVLLEKSYGMADRETNTPNTPQTKFPAFGIKNLMSAVGIMKLQEEGKLSIGDKLCSYLGSCPAAWQPITLEELLIGTAGIPSYDWASSTGGTGETMAGCQAQPLVVPPGQQIVDSGCSPFLLGAVIEKVSGTSWSNFMQQTIFGPAGMTNSGSWANGLLPPQRARGYVSTVPAPGPNYNATYGAYSTLEDISRFDAALLAGTILSRQSLGALFAPRMPRYSTLNGDESYIGYGQTDVFKESQTEVGHVGTVGDSEGWGFGVTDFFSPEDGTVGIELNNDTGAFTAYDNDHLWDFVVRPALFRK